MALRASLLAVGSATSLLLASCGGDEAPAPTPTPTPTPSATSVASYDVATCFNQLIPGKNGMTLKKIVTPDTLRLDLTQPVGWPNGRDLDDPVVDLLLSMLFIDFSVTGQGTQTFVNLPLNPPANDKAFSDTFPFMAPPQGTPPLAATTGTSFDFRTDPESAYVQVDRMGNPAIATALISSSQKSPFNDVGPPADTAGQFTADQNSTLIALQRGLADDLTNLGLKLCSKPL